MKQRRLGFLVLLSFLSVFILSGCDHYSGWDDGYYYTPWEPFPDGSNYDAREDYLNHFPLKNTDGVEAAAIEPQTGLKPFGALVGFDSGNVYYCTVTHLQKLTVATNAHCIDHSTSASDYYVIFYNHFGTKVHYVTTDVLYRGNTKGDDIALLSISPEAAAAWDEAGVTIRPTSDDIDKPGHALKVTVWAYDPIKDSNGSATSSDTSGMIFAPRHCQGSRLLPKTVGITTHYASEDTETILTHQDTDSSIHFFFDGCDRVTEHGNSGSLVTVSDDFRQKIGVHHWRMFPTSKLYDYFDVTDVNGDKKRYSASELPGDTFFEVGTVFEAVRDSSTTFRQALE